MEGVITLLDRAQAAGLEVRIDDDRLVIRGPPSMDALARQLLAHKGDVVRVLTAPPADVIGDESCGMCGSRERWHWLHGWLLCRGCLIRGGEPLELHGIGPLASPRRRHQWW
jgi:hypothetical protein